LWKSAKEEKLMIQFTFLAFLDFKKAYYSVPIYNMLTKLSNIGIRDKCLQFITNLYPTLIALSKLNGKHLKEFPLHWGIHQRCPLSPIVFKIFIIDIFDKCKRYDMIIER